MPRSKAVDDAIERGQDIWYEVVTVPRFETPLDADRTFGSVAVVVVSEPGAEALRHHLERGHGLREAMEHAHPVRLVVGRGEHRHRLGAQVEALRAGRLPDDVVDHVVVFVVFVVDGDDPRRRLVVRPLADPPLVEPGRHREIAGRQGLAGRGQRGEQSELVAEVDHPGGDGTAELGVDPE